ncbi:reverse transcriptase domain-containing protein [Tanacetum coccineum]
MYGWLIEDEEEVKRNEVDSDLKSTASSKPVWKKTTKANHDRASRNGGGEMEMWYTTDALLRHSNLVIPRSRWERRCDSAYSLDREDGKCELIVVVVRRIKRQVDVKNSAQRNEDEKLENDFGITRMVELTCLAYTDRYIAELAPEIRVMLRATQPTTIQNAILRARIFTDEAVSCGTLTKGNNKRKVVEESGKSGGSWKDNKKAKVGIGFVVTTPPRNEVANSNPKSFSQHLSQDESSTEAIQDPNIVTGTFSLNDHFVTVLFDSGATLCFISTEFALLPKLVFTS